MLLFFVQAFGCHTTVFSRGTGKKESVMGDLKADAFIDSTNADEMKVCMLYNTVMYACGVVESTMMSRYMSILLFKSK